MPLYEYECPKDGMFERIQKFSDPPLAACPICGGPIEKLASAPAIQFKGTGWYITDYARKSSGEGGKDKGGAKESSKESASSTASSTTSETKSGGSETKPSTSSSSEKSEKK